MIQLMTVEQVQAYQPNIIGPAKDHPDIARLPAYWVEQAQEDGQLDSVIITEHHFDQEIILVEQALQLGTQGHDQGVTYLSEMEATKMGAADLCTAFQLRDNYGKTKNEPHAQRPLRAQALYLLDVKERLDGKSLFTVAARQALTYGQTGTLHYKALAYFAFKAIEHRQKYKDVMPLPKKPFKAPEGSGIMQDLGAFTLVRVTPYRSGYGSNTFCVASNEAGEGICFNQNPANLKKAGLTEGSAVDLRGNPGKVLAFGDKQYLKCLRVKIK